MKINVAVILYFGKECIAGCDRKCEKAWGISLRPHEHLSLDNEDDIVYLADGELGQAPADPGTYEGPHGKPHSPDRFPNKWCIRQCERSDWVEVDSGKPLDLHDWSKRLYNIPRDEPHDFMEQVPDHGVQPDGSVVVKHTTRQGKGHIGRIS